MKQKNKSHTPHSPIWKQLSLQELEIEYDLIKEKKSNLSSIQRKEVVYYFETKNKKTKEETNLLGNKYVSVKL